MDPSPAFIIVGINFYPEPTGIAPYTTDLARWLSHNGSVRVITGIPHYPWWEKALGFTDTKDQLTFPELSIHRMKHYVPKSPTNFKRLLMEVSFGIKAALRLDLNARCVILVSPGLVSSALTLLWLRWRGSRAKTVLWVQDLYTQGILEIGGKTSISLRFLQAVEGWVCRSVDKIVVAHDSFAKAIAQLNGNQESSVLTIRNWSQFKFSPKTKVNRASFELAREDERLVVHIGNMGVKQGLENVIEAAKLADLDSSKVRFLLVGDGNQRGKLTALAAGCKSITFLPPVDDAELVRILSHADLLLVNEKPEVKQMSVPSKLTTYFQTNIPVLVCAERESNAAQEVLRGNLGFWVNSGDARLLLDRINSIDLRYGNILAKKAKKYSLETLSPEVAQTKFLEMFVVLQKE